MPEKFSPPKERVPEIEQSEPSYIQPIPTGPYGSGIPLTPLMGCKWATGHNGHEHLFCNAERKPGRPYCEKHHKLAHPPVEEKDDEH